MGLSRPSQPGKGGGWDQNPDFHLPWPRPVLGGVAFHQDSLLQLCTSVGLSRMHPGAWPRIQTSRTEQQEVLPRGGVGGVGAVRRAASCLALGAALLRSHFTLSPQFLLAGSQESWETVLVSFSLGDELSRSLPFSGSQFPPRWNQVSSSAASPTPPLGAVLTDTDFLEQSTTFGKEVV